jgi:hypothetical protein
MTVDTSALEQETPMRQRRETVKPKDIPIRHSLIRRR